MGKRSLFIMSSERSGSNLLRRVLGAHSRFADPPAPQLFRSFSKIVHFYGDLKREENCRCLIEDCLQMVNLKGTRFDWGLDISVEEVFQKLEKKDLSGVVLTLYDIYAEKQGKEGWVCKENDLFDHVPFIRNSKGEHGFIYLVRDGRDVAVSEKKIPTRSPHVLNSAEKWKREQRSSIRAFQEFDEKERFLFFYEDFLEDPRASIEALSEHFGFEVEDRMLEFHKEGRSGKEASSSQFWENLSKPILSGNRKKYLEGLKEKELRLFEAIAGQELEILGYSCEYPERKKVPKTKEWGVRGLNGLRKLLFSRKKRLESDTLIYEQTFERIAKSRSKNPLPFF